MKIEKDDIVKVDFYNAQTTLCHEARVMYMPLSVGDSWIFLDLEKDRIHYVSEGCTITLIGKCPK